MAANLEAAFGEYLTGVSPTLSELASAASHRDSVEEALAALGPVAMDETGSLKHGTAVAANCDSDYFLWLPHELRKHGPTSNLNSIRDLLKVRFPRSSVRVARPAVAIYFTGAAGTVEVVPAFYSTTRGVHRVFSIPDPAGAATDSWIESSPESHLAYVNACDTRHYGRTKSLARLLKAWKYHNNVPIGSFYLEMQAARRAATEPAIIYSWDLRDLFRDMKSSGLRDMNDPSGAQVGRIGACSSDSNRNIALAKISTAHEWAQEGERLRTAGDDVRAAWEFQRIYGSGFPYVY